MNQKTGELKRSLGFWLLSFYGIGMILGAGIYSVIGKAAAQSQYSLWISFIFAAVAAALTALSYAELATMYPSAGAEYTYLKRAFPKLNWLANATGLMVAFSGAATVATVALAFAGYVNSFTEASLYFAALSLILVFSLINIAGIQESSWVNVLFTIIEVSGLLLFIYLGLNSEKFGQALSAVPTGGTLTSAALIIFAFFGFENIVTLGEESKEPQKTIPRAILFSLILCTIIYILVSLAALALMEPNELAQSGAVMTDAAKKSSPSIAKVLGAIALFSTANTALISLVSTSRVLYGMAKEKSLPRVMAKVSIKRKTPWVAAIVAGVTAAILIPLGKIEVVASVSSFTTMTCFLLVNIALIYLRFTSNIERRFKVPLNIGKFPVLAVLAICVCILFLFQFTEQVYMISFVVVTSSFIGGWLFARNAK